MRKRIVAYSNYSELGRRDRSFAGPAFLPLTPRRVLLSAFGRIALLERKGTRGGGPKTLHAPPRLSEREGTC
jgi:hypothetical protein